jgi:hypothetical protein
MARISKIQIRRGTALQWCSANPVLASGEPALETDTNKFKVGDGSTAWNSLRYVGFDGGNLDAPAPPCGSSSSSSSSSSGGIISCPAPSMRILLADGSQIPAGDLKSGMTVRTNHEDTMELGDYEVTQVSIVQAERISMTIGKTGFICSDSHKFHVNGSWKEAGSFEVGDLIGGEKVEAIENIGPGEVVRITVDSAHTYVCEGFLSHNKSELPYPQMMPEIKQVSW